MKTWNGIYTALVTPFKPEGAVDYLALNQLIKQQVRSNISGLVILGSTGEANAISSAERNDLIVLCKEKLPDDKALIVGTSSGSVAQSLTFCEQAQTLGADAVLLTPPFYAKTSQEGVKSFYHFISKHTSIPIILYNNPSRTGQVITFDTLKTLALNSSIIAFKESSNDSTLMHQLLLDKTITSNLSVLVGDDMYLFSGMSLGAHGAICVMSNLLPQQVIELFTAIQNNDLNKARELFTFIFPLIQILAQYPNPTGIKHALAHLGEQEPHLRLPLVSLSQEEDQHLVQALSPYIATHAN